MISNTPSSLYQKIRQHLPLLLSIFAIVVFVTAGDHAFAQGVTDATADAGSDIFDSIKILLGVILNIIYIIIWPILVLAGTAMDNTLIYGWFINLDKPLFLLRNISRTFANFLLVAILITEIIKMASGENVDKKKIVINLVIAGIGINASRFVLGALLDVSTVATYGIGALPMTTLNQVRQEKMPIMMIHSYLNLSTDDSDTPTTPWSTTADDDITTSLLKYNSFINNHVYYSRWSVTIPTCEVHKGYIIGATQYPYVLDKHGKPMSGINFANTCAPWKSSNCEHLYCALWPTIAIDLKDFETHKRAILYDSIQASIDNDINVNAKENEINKRINHEVSIILDHIASSGTCNEITGTYSTIGKNDIEKLMSSAIGTNINDKNKKVCGQTINNVASASSLMAIISGDSRMQGQWWLFLEELMEKSQWLVWPLVTIYISILDFSNITSVSDTMKDTTSVGVIIEFIMKAVAAIFMIIPLITLALVLLMRVWILRAIIAFSPFIVVLRVFKESGIVSSISGSTESYTSAKAVIWLIFAPVVPVFALGIGMIIIQTLQLRMHEWLGESQSTRGFLGVNFQASWVGDNKDDNNETCADFWWLTEMCYDTGSDTETGSIYNDLFGWIILNILAIGIMRAIVKASFAASSITSSIANKTLDMGKNLLWSIPLIPIPGTWGAKLSASSLLKVPDTISNVASSKFNQITTAGERSLQELEEKMNNKLWNNTTSNAWATSIFWSLSGKTKTSIATELNSKNLGKSSEIKNIIQTKAKENSESTDDLITSINNMNNEQLEEFIKELEWVNQAKKTALTDIIQKERKVNDIDNKMKSYVIDKKVANMEQAKKFLSEFNTTENKDLIDNNRSSFTISNWPVEIEWSDQVLMYDDINKEFTISDKPSTTTTWTKPIDPNASVN